MSKKRSPAALWKAIQDAAVEDDVEEVLAMSDAELDKFIADNGGDPAKIRAAGDALGKDLEAQRERLAWHEDVEAKLDDVRARVNAKRAAPRPKLSREELRMRIDRARNDPRFAAPVAALFRSKTLEAHTIEELEALLDKIELLAKLEDE
jgi:hypothetical protein